jgi:hypothetical protein
MSESTMTPQTAPRDRNRLLTESPFQLRILVQKLGGLSTDEQKMSWHDMKSKEAQIDYVLKLLLQWDQANPGAAQAPPPAGPVPTSNGAMPYQPPPMMQAPPQQMVPQQPQQSMQPAPHYAPPGVMPHAPIPGAMMQAPPQVPQVNPAAAQQVQQATTETTKARRQPRTPSDAQAPQPTADIGVEIVGLLTTLKASADAQVARYDQFQSYLTSLLQEASDSKNSRVTALEAKYADVHATLQQTNQYLQSISQVQTWTLLAFLTFMQENMGASMTDLLGAAISDSATFQQLVNKATGKV